MTKKLLDGSSFSQRFARSAPGYSPYVFYIHFSKIYGVVPEQEIMLIKPPVFMTFSTGLFDLMAHVCNRAIIMKNKETVLGLKLVQIHLLPHKSINSGVVKFQVLGHAALRGRNGYLGNASAPGEIEEAINTHLQTKLKFFKQCITAPFNNSVFGPVKIIEHRALAKGVCQHYGGKITTIKGSLTLAGFPASLQFLYDFGLGVRTGQGFGLLEAVKQL